GPVPALLRPLVRAIAAGAQKSYIDPQLALHMDYWEAELGGSAWVAGADFSAADIQISFPAEAAAARFGLPLGERLRGFLQRIHARPAYQRALSAGGGFNLPG